MVCDSLPKWQRQTVTREIWAFVKAPKRKSRQAFLVAMMSQGETT